MTALHSSLPPSRSSSPQFNSTPKRKRNGNPPTPPSTSPEIRLNTNIPCRTLPDPSIDAGTESPRTKVAYDFQGMCIEDGGLVSKLNFQRTSAPPEDETQEESLARKKVKVLGDEHLEITLRKEIPETPLGFRVAIGPEQGAGATAGNTVLGNTDDPMIFKGSSEGKPKAGLARAYPSINRLADSKSRVSRKRMGTPPLLGSGGASLDAEIDEAERRVVDPDRAALTWHEDEITGHDPTDPDDDGEGINGIGFRPTPAIAYARTEKRRLQMAEYRNREAKEARAKRSERRRGGWSSKTSSKDEEMAVGEEAARRVRFLDGMVENVIPMN